MSFSLEKVVPWGRSFDEYVAMFSLSGADLQKRILGCGDGPAAFNALLNAQGGRVISVDPLYRHACVDIRRRIDETYAEVLAQTRKNQHEFHWGAIKSVDDLGRIRMAAMRVFLDDYAKGVAEGRYVDGELPTLPFADGRFDLAVCSHLLFLYSEQFSRGFHRDSILELCRVANEVRIFPLLELGSKPSRHLSAMIDDLGGEGYEATLVQVDYEFQRGGNQMMRIRRPAART